MPPASSTISLSSRGVPSEQPLLNCNWIRSVEEPRVNGAPHYVSFGGKGAAANASLHLYLSRDGMWQIAPEVGARLAYAVARSPARHPNTVRAGEWLLPKPPTGAWLPAADFHLRHEGPNNETVPFTLDDLGYDFFLRVKTTKLVWFIDPVTGETVHSGAKGAGAAGKPGKRFCPLCKQCFSANNFVSQHLKNLHTPPPPSAPTVASDGTGGALLGWRVDGCPAGAAPIGYMLEASTDGGLTFEILVDDTGSAEPRARLTSLNLSKSYQFRIAAHSAAVLGPHGPASASFTPGGPAGSGVGAPRAVQDGTQPAAAPADGSPDGIAAAAAMQAAAALRPDLVDTLTPPTSPPPYPIGSAAAGGELLATSSGAGAKRARDDDFDSGRDLDSGRMDELFDNLASDKKPELLSCDTDELLWTLEELVACTEPSGGSSAPSKRPRPAEVNGGMTTMLPLARVESNGAAANAAPLAPRSANAPPELTRNPSSGFGASEPELFLQSLLASFAEEPQQPNYRSAEAWAAKDAGPPMPSIAVAYSRRSPGALARAKSGGVWKHAAPANGNAPAATNGEVADGDDGDGVARLVRLRSALQNAPPAQLTKLVTPELLTSVGSVGEPLSRELKLLLTYADPSTVAEAASKEVHVNELNASLTCNPGNLPTLLLPPPSTSLVFDGSKKTTRRLSETTDGGSASTGFPLMMMMAVMVLGVVLAMVQPETLAATIAAASAAVAPPPPPTCKFTWKRLGCVASDRSKGYCRLTQLGVCEPKQRA